MQIDQQTSSSEKLSAYFLLATEQSENSEYNIPQSINFLRNFPTFQQPIRNMSMVSLMMTFVEQFGYPVYLQQNFDKKPFYLRNLSTSKTFFDSKKY